MLLKFVFLLRLPSFTEIRRRQTFKKVSICTDITVLSRDGTTTQKDLFSYQSRIKNQLWISDNRPLKKIIHINLLSSSVLPVPFTCPPNSEVLARIKTSYKLKGTYRDEGSKS